MQFTIFSQYHRPSVTSTTETILCKHTHVYTSIASFWKGGRGAKHHEAAMWVSPNSTPLNFFNLQSLLLNATPKYFKFPTFSKHQKIYKLGHIVMVWNPHWSSKTQNKKRNVTCQCMFNLLITIKVQKKPLCVSEFQFLYVPASNRYGKATKPAARREHALRSYILCF
jgi:hypothetical protein